MKNMYSVSYIYELASSGKASGKARIGIETDIAANRTRSVHVTAVTISAEFAERSRLAVTEDAGVLVLTHDETPVARLGLSGVEDRSK